MLEQFLKQTSELIAQGETFAVATVVRCLPPTSGKPGDKAIVFADGKLWGWIGGGCAQPVVAKEALKALAEEKPKLVRISPKPDAPEEGIVDYTMTCHSGGSLDIYIEPVLPKPHLVILGRSPVARTLARLGTVVGYKVSLVVEEASVGQQVGRALSTQHSAFSPETVTGTEAGRATAVLKADTGEGFEDLKIVQARGYSLETAKVTGRALIVVSTQGEGDEEALEQALKVNGAYVAFVASKTKTEKVLEYLRGRGVTAEQIKRVQAPAGLDIGAKSPEEIAVSILAQIIQVRRHAGMLRERNSASSPLSVLSAGNTEAVDPVCGMSVNPGTARHSSDYEGVSFYFCCAGCKQAFDREPQRYLAGTGK